MCWSSATSGEYAIRCIALVGAEGECRDMHARVSLWCSLAEMGWPVPPREPLSKAELVEEERLHRAMLEARRFASEDDLLTYCRSVRSFVGSKSC